MTVLSLLLHTQSVSTPETLLTCRPFAQRTIACLLVPGILCDLRNLPPSARPRTAISFWLTQINLMPEKAVMCLWHHWNNSSVGVRRKSVVVVCRLHVSLSHQHHHRDFFLKEVPFTGSIYTKVLKVHEQIAKIFVVSVLTCSIITEVIYSCHDWHHIFV